MHPSNVERLSCFSVTTERLVGWSRVYHCHGKLENAKKQAIEPGGQGVSECNPPAPRRPTIDAARQDALIHYHKSQTNGP